MSILWQGDGQAADASRGEERDAADGGVSPANQQPDAGPPLLLDEWLDDQEAERRALIMRLRQIERNLMAYGRLRAAWTTAAQEAGSPLAGRKSSTGR